MRVQSDFKDYYDAGMATGQDQTLVYRRYVDVVELENYPFPACITSSAYSYRGDPAPLLHARSCMVGFCGRLHPLLIVYPHEHAHGKGSEARKARKIVYNIDELDTYVRNHFSEEKYEDYLTTKYRKYAIWPTWHRRVYFSKFFDEAEKYKDSYARYFEEKRCPVFVCEYNERQNYRWRDIHGRLHGKKDKPYRIVYNACIKDYEFYRVFDTHAAYQEIAMWLGNQAEPRKPIPEIDDETMAEIKGLGTVEEKSQEISRRLKEKSRNDDYIREEHERTEPKNRQSDQDRV